MESLSKKTGSSCQAKQASKRAELNKLYKKVGFSPVKNLFKARKMAGIEDFRVKCYKNQKISEFKM